MNGKTQIPKSILDKLPEFDEEKYEYSWEGGFDVAQKTGDVERWSVGTQKWFHGPARGDHLSRRPIRWELVMNRKDWQDGDQWCFLADWQRHYTEWCTDRPLPHILSSDIIIRRRIQ